MVGLVYFQPLQGGAICPIDNWSIYPENEFSAHPWPALPQAPVSNSNHLIEDKIEIN